MPTLAAGTVGDAAQTRRHSAADARARRFRMALVAADVSAVSVALVAALLVGGSRPSAVTLLGLPLVVALGKAYGLYDRDELTVRKTTLDEAPQLFQLATTYALAFWLLGVDGSLDRVQTLTLGLTLFAASLVARRVARVVALQTTDPERCMFVGDALAYQRLAAKFVDDRINAELVGRMSLQRVAPRGRRVAGEEDLRALLDWTDVHRIIIEPQTLPADEMLDFVRAAQSVGVRVSLLPRVLDVVGSSVVFDDVNGAIVLGVRRFGLTQSSRWLKRGLDIVGAALALTAIAPLMALIAIAIVLDSRGPVFFRQTRVGRDGRHFRIWKFRTMVVDAEQRKSSLEDAARANGGLFKLAADPRVTRVGRFLRRTSLDELPQLLNVLDGSMSLVGPRPLVVDEDEQIEGWDRRRLHLTPGITGPWQILGSTRVPMHEMVKLDYVYIADWSLWSDIKIMLRTVLYMFGRRNC